MGKSPNRLLPDRAKRQKTTTPAPFTLKGATGHNGQFAMSSPITACKISPYGKYVNGFFQVFLDGGTNPENFTDFSCRLFISCLCTTCYDNTSGFSLFSPASTSTSSWRKSEKGLAVRERAGVVFQ
jgi:hypothetical protein